MKASGSTARSKLLWIYMIPPGEGPRNSSGEGLGFDLLTEGNESILAENGESISE